MDPRIIDILRYSALTVVLLVASLFVHKHYRRHVAKKEIVAELQSITTDSSFYRQFEAEAAHATLLQSVALIQQASDLGLTPTELFDRVFLHDQMDDFGESPSTDYPVKEELARNTLTSAYESAKRLEILNDKADISDLQDGRMPISLSGTPVILPLIDPKLSPGLEKIIPNLEILPADRANSERELTAIETAAARKLAKDLATAGLIENTIAERIVEHYQSKKKVASEDAATE
ncbi:hypothetical protein ACFQY0_16650 [Haloferula chungangensis]|uniref:DUF4230 domain-containing protein n=1 Tax=Haloferula chungangensis TaxID=1048331 RepID=A0ABW2LAX9_9BACT